MLDKIKREVVTLLARVRIRTEAEVQAMEEAERQRSEARAQQMAFQHESAGGLGADEEAAQVAGTPGTMTRDLPKIGRNDPCPCGSGKKYKHCHGQLA